MAIPDLLWACPSCGRDRGLREKAGRCTACRTRFERVDGALIRATTPDGATTTLDAAAWILRLPSPHDLLEAAAREQGSSTVRTARVSARHVTGEQPVRARGRYLNRREVYGPEHEGTLELALDRAIFRREGEDPAEWRFDALTAVQASSRSLQLKSARLPLVSFRFLDDSSFLWERLVTAAVRRFYRETGRGEIIELQPRIVTR